jgi:hypothetical protein
MSVFLVVEVSHSQLILAEGHYNQRAKSRPWLNCAEIYRPARLNLHESGIIG